MLRRAGSVVRDHHARYVLAHEIRIPHALRRQREDRHRLGDAVFRARLHPGQERRPDRLHLRLVQPMAQHAQVQLAAAETHLLAPVRIEQIAAIKRDCLGDQGAIRGIGGCLDRAEHRAEERRQFARAQGQPGDHAEAAAATALEAPVQVRIRARCCAMRTWPSAVTTSASSNPAAAAPSCLEKLPKPPLCTSPATPTVVQPPPCTSRLPWWSPRRRLRSARAGADAHRRLGHVVPTQPSPTKASCKATASMCRVHTSYESRAFEVPW
ncbi:hypothetical protein RLIN73S_03274 [Rhodanobacter lindaniclasticus]